MQGAFRLVDKHKFALSSIQRVEHATGMDFADVRFSLGAKLILLGDFDENDRPWQERIKNDHDWKCGGETSGLMLDQEYDRVIDKLANSPGLLLRLAQGHLPCEEGWILGQTPLPHPLLNSWPTEQFLAGDYHCTPTSRKIHDSLRPLALEGIDPDEVVLAACLEASSWREHYKYEYWLQESENASESNEGMPTTLNGRTFTWMTWDNWYEPGRNNGSQSICFSVAGQQHLLNAFPKLFPSKIWISKFGWVSSANNPFKWYSGGQPAVRYEVLHGPLGSHRTNAQCLQTVHRWVAKSSAFERVMEKMPLLKVCERFTRAPLQEL
jgi:hypothetical protein